MEPIVLALSGDVGASEPYGCVETTVPAASTWPCGAAEEAWLFVASTVRARLALWVAVAVVVGGLAGGGTPSGGGAGSCRGGVVAGDGGAEEGFAGLTSGAAPPHRLVTQAHPDGSSPLRRSDALDVPAANV